MGIIASLSFVCASICTSEALALKTSPKNDQKMNASKTAQWMGLTPGMKFSGVTEHTFCSLQLEEIREPSEQQLLTQFKVKYAQKSFVLEEAGPSGWTGYSVDGQHIIDVQFRPEALQGENSQLPVETIEMRRAYPTFRVAQATGLGNRIRPSKANQLDVESCKPNAPQGTTQESHEIERAQTGRRLSNNF